MLLAGVVPHLQGGPAHEGEEHGGELELGRELLGGEDGRRHHLARLGDQLHAQARQALRALLEVGLADGQLRGAGLEHDGVARPRVRHLRRRRDQDVHLAVGAELELVDVGLGLRPGAAADLPLAERRAEGHAEVGALAPVPDEAVGAGVVEHGEEVVHVGVVDQELAIVVLEREEPGMQGVGALHDPVQREAAEAGHPPVALGQVHVALGDAGRLAHDVERRRLRRHPGLECRIQTFVLHRADATHVSHGVAGSGRAR